MSLLSQLNIGGRNSKSMFRFDFISIRDLAPLKSEANIWNSDNFERFLIITHNKYAFQLLPSHSLKNTLKSIPNRDHACSIRTGCSLTKSPNSISLIDCLLEWNSSRVTRDSRVEGEMNPITFEEDFSTTGTPWNVLCNQKRAGFCNSFVFYQWNDWRKDPNEGRSSAWSERISCPLCATTCCSASARR